MMVMNYEGHGVDGFIFILRMVKEQERQQEIRIWILLCCGSPGRVPAGGRVSPAETRPGLPRQQKDIRGQFKAFSSFLYVQLCMSDEIIELSCLSLEGDMNITCA
jgi:hypothetical protein